MQKNRNLKWDLQSLSLDKKYCFFLLFYFTFAHFFSVITWSINSNETLIFASVLFDSVTDLSVILIFLLWKSCNTYHKNVQRLEKNIRSSYFWSCISHLCTSCSNKSTILTEFDKKKYTLTSAYHRQVKKILTIFLYFIRTAMPNTIYLEIFHWLPHDWKRVNGDVQNIVKTPSLSRWVYNWIESHMRSNRHQNHK